MQVMKIEVGQWELEEAQAWDLLSDEANGLHKPILAWSSCTVAASRLLLLRSTR